jgi:chromosomal replication initiator protein
MIVHASLPAAPMGGLVAQFSRPRATVRELVTVTEEIAELPRGSICGPARDRCVAWPRQALMLAIRDGRGMSYPEIGRRLGGRDHTTIIHGVDAARKRRLVDVEFARLCDAISARVAA